MKKSYVFFLLSLLSSLRALPQTNYPLLQPGTTQGVRHFIDPNYPPENWSFTHKDDSTWCGYTYSRICYIQNGFSTSCDIPSFTRGIREEIGIAYIRGTSCGGETVQYDFNLALGDTFDMGPWYGDAIVDSIGTQLMLNGQTRKYIKLESIGEPGVYFRWVEGIGDIDRGFFRSANMDGGYSQLICQSDSSGLVYVNPNFNVNCDSLLLLSSTGQDIHSLSYRLYPNPASSQVFLNVPTSGSIEFLLMDVTGKIVAKTTVTSGITINVSDLGNGIYLYQLHHNGRTYNGKLLISH